MHILQYVCHKLCDNASFPKYFRYGHELSDFNKWHDETKTRLGHVIYVYYHVINLVSQVSDVL